MNVKASNTRRGIRGGASQEGYARRGIPGRIPLVLPGIRKKIERFHLDLDYPRTCLHLTKSHLRRDRLPRVDGPLGGLLRARRPVARPLRPVVVEDGRQRVRPVMRGVPGRHPPHVHPPVLHHGRAHGLLRRRVGHRQGCSSPLHYHGRAADEGGPHDGVPAVVAPARPAGVRVRAAGGGIHAVHRVFRGRAARVRRPLLLLLGVLHRPLQLLQVDGGREGVEVRRRVVTCGVVSYHELGATKKFRCGRGCQVSAKLVYRRTN